MKNTKILSLALATTLFPAFTNAAAEMPFAYNSSGPEFNIELPEPQKATVPYDIDYQDTVAGAAQLDRELNPFVQAYTALKTLRKEKPSVLKDPRAMLGPHRHQLQNLLNNKPRRQQENLAFALRFVISKGFYKAEDLAEILQNSPDNLSLVLHVLEKAESRVPKDIDRIVAHRDTHYTTATQYINFKKTEQTALENAERVLGR